MNDVFEQGKEVLYIVLLGLFPGIVYLTAVAFRLGYATSLGIIALIVSLALYVNLKLERYTLTRIERRGKTVRFTDRFGWSRITPRKLYIRLKILRLKHWIRETFAQKKKKRKK